MIRLIIIIVLLFLIWVLFVSDFKRQMKIVISVVAVLLCALGIWFDGYGENPKTGVIDLANIEVCGVEAKHSYRSNFDVTLCLKNTAENGTAKRIQFAVIVKRCGQDSECQVLERVVRDRPLELLAQQTITLTENLSFKQVNPADKNLVWNTEIVQIKAIR